MPHLWMFLLQSLTPREHEVLLIDGNTQPMSDADVVRYVLDRKIGLVGIGAMTRMVAKAYRFADAIRAAGVPVVMGGPHVTELPGEALGRDGGPRHADAVAFGEADKPWETFHIIPIESGRGCPYGRDFCMVTGFFGDSIRYRSNQSIVNEMLRLKARAQCTRGKIAVFFVD